MSGGGLSTDAEAHNFECTYTNVKNKLLLSVEVHNVKPPTRKLVMLKSPTGIDNCRKDTSEGS